MELRTYTEPDYALTQALETDPDVMRHLGGPIDPAKLPDLHRRRLGDPWWFTIGVEAGAPPVGTIGIWETRHGDETLHETGWMVLPEYQGRGIASAALRLLLERARSEPAFRSVHAFPPVSNTPSNALCRKFDFTLLGEFDFVYSGRALRCNHWTRSTVGDAAS